jgi:LacI family transcriptional regulator
MISKKTTLKDIANVLGLTPSAISKALNNHPRISEKTKNDVKIIAKKLNYQPNYLASALRKGKSNLVGVIVPRNSSNFFSIIVENIEEVLNKNGYSVIFTQSNESFKKECSCIEALLYTQVDGIIASIANETTDLTYYKKIKEKGIPLILFDRGESSLEVDYIGIDDYISSHKVIEHLVDQNCKRIAHIAGFKHTRIYKNRIDGYIDGLKKYGLPIEDELIVESNLRIEDGRRIMEDLLKLPNRPDAVYAAGDYAALGALQVLQEHNINVPIEIALVGFSNEPFTSYTNPSITTINQHSKKIGQLAAKAFLDRIENPKMKVTLNRKILESELIIRSSSNRNNSS